MNIKSPKYLQASSLFSCHKGSALDGNATFGNRNIENPFGDTFPDPLCKLNLRETSEFVKTFAIGNNDGESGCVLETTAQRRREGMGPVAQRRLEAPPTPGRPVFSFSAGNLPRKSVPSKWEDAEKWLINSSCHDSPAHAIKPPEVSSFSKQNVVFHQKGEVFSEKSRVAEDKVSRAASNFHCSIPVDHPDSASNGVSASLLLKEKFTDDVEQIFPSFRCSEEAIKERFLFRNSVRETVEDAATDLVPEVQHRDIGTEMTPLGSSTTSRCHTPIKSSSPARHNTPSNRSGPLGTNASPIDITELQECHFTKLDLGGQFDSVVSNWSSREEEEEEVSKSLRHSETDSGCPKSTAESRASAWKEEVKTKSCLRYQREEAKIQAWVNLQSAKAEAQSKKLEVKIQKMRSNLEEKLMKRMAMVHRKAEEWRARAQLQHAQQIPKDTGQAQKMNQHNSYFSDHPSCGCFPCNNYYP